MNRQSEMVTATKRPALSRTQRRILYQVMHHVQESSHYGFGDVFFLSGPSIDFLALELGRLPHQIVETVNALIELSLVSIDFENNPPNRTNVVCPNCEGWRQHPNFTRLLPWIAGSEQRQDWFDEPEFEEFSIEQLDALGSDGINELDLSLPNVCTVIPDETNGENAEVRPQYVLQPTGKQLLQLANTVSRQSVITCVVPGVGNCHFMTATRLIRDLGDAKERGVIAGPLYRQDKSSQHYVEAAYIHRSRLYFVLDFYDLKAPAHSA